VSILIGILGLALLMVIHEGGHLLAARAFGMRVIRFSIGFGPALWRHQPKGSDTVYQVALIPFLAYVQIAGMNALEDIDPDDKGSYANASLIGRISAIFAGPLANYLFASVLFMGAFLIGGDTTRIQVIAGGADFQLSAAGGLEIEARYTLRTGDGALIAVRNCGGVGGTVPLFEAASSGPHAFLNDGDYFGRIGLALGGVVISVYEAER